MKTILLVVLLLAVSVSAEVYFNEEFDDAWSTRWIPSEANKDYGKWKVSAGKFYNDAEKDKGLQTSQDAKFYAISTKFPEFSNKDKKLVLQFQVKHEQNIDCGGGYIKLMPAGLDEKKFNGDSEYSIMFGPDICGATKKIHLIFTYKKKNLLWKKSPICPSDELTHLYTMVLNPDNTYEVHVDMEKKESGKLEDDWEFLQPKQIKDPEAKKPTDWDDRKEVPDAGDKKPEGYDDIPKQIVDETAKKPDDWDAEEDGEWTAPMIDNPEYKGEWKQKMIPNPNYKGEWEADMIENPDYVYDDKLYLIDSISFAGFDLWQVKSGTIFDNIWIGDSLTEAEKYAKKTYKKTVEGEKKMKAVQDEKDAAERKAKEEERKAKEEAEKKKKEAEEKEKEAEEVVPEPAEVKEDL